MGIDFKDLLDHPVQAVLAIVALLVFGTIGIGPIRAIRTRAIKQTEAGSEEADSRKSQIRAGDNVVARFQEIAEKAQAKAEEEFELRRAAVTQAAKDVAAAQKDAHDVRNEAIISIRAVELEARTSIQAADARATAAEMRARAAETESLSLRSELQQVRIELDDTKARLDALIDRGSFKATDSTILEATKGKLR